MKIEIVLAAAFGSALQELLYWHELRHKLRASKCRETLQSGAYWIVTLLMVIGSGIAVGLVYGSQLPRNPLEYILLGASFPALFKKLVLLKSQQKLNLGDHRASALEMYFQLNQPPA